jgi:hypothetical protein
MTASLPSAFRPPRVAGSVPPSTNTPSGKKATAAPQTLGSSASLASLGPDRRPEITYIGPLGGSSTAAKALLEARNHVASESTATPRDIGTPRKGGRLAALDQSGRRHAATTPLGARDAALEALGFSDDSSDGSPLSARRDSSSTLSSRPSTAASTTSGAHRSRRPAIVQPLAGYSQPTLLEMIDELDRIEWDPHSRLSPESRAKAADIAHARWGEFKDNLHSLIDAESFSAITSLADLYARLETCVEQLKGYSAELDAHLQEMREGATGRSSNILKVASTAGKVHQILDALVVQLKARPLDSRELRGVSSLDFEGEGALPKANSATLEQAKRAAYYILRGEFFKPVEILGDIGDLGLSEGPVKEGLQIARDYTLDQIDTAFVAFLGTTFPLFDVTGAAILASRDVSHYFRPNLVDLAVLEADMTSGRISPKDLHELATFRETVGTRHSYKQAHEVLKRLSTYGGLIAAAISAGTGGFVTPLISGLQALAKVGISLRDKALLKEYYGPATGPELNAKLEILYYSLLQIRDKAKAGVELSVRDRYLVKFGQSIGMGETNYDPFDSRKSPDAICRDVAKGLSSSTKMHAYIPKGSTERDATGDHRDATRGIVLDALEDAIGFAGDVVDAV